LSNTFEENKVHMNASEQQAMLEEIRVKIFYMGKSMEDPKRATLMFQGAENVLYDIFTNPKIKKLLKPQVIFMKVQ
tara:strand:+ start:800 stop:1027 length:228 start_codon:yes stop_codon:yes gene_type:complete